MNQNGEVSMVKITYKTLTGEGVTGYIRTGDAIEIIWGNDNFVQVFGDEKRTKIGPYINVDCISEIYYWFLGD